MEDFTIASIARENLLLSEALIESLRRRVKALEEQVERLKDEVAFKSNELASLRQVHVPKVDHHPSSVPTICDEFGKDIIVYHPNIDAYQRIQASESYPNSAASWEPVAKHTPLNET